MSVSFYRFDSLIRPRRSTVYADRHRRRCTGRADRLVSVRSMAARKVCLARQSEIHASFPLGIELRNSDDTPCPGDCKSIPRSPVHTPCSCS
jgi:hypothetical protein